uniref:Uncharacterized protein n=1 Tax=Tenacibaculum sp. Pbs-1 TaxID=3238748 RepID=A0AB33L3E3_9FLAO
MNKILFDRLRLLALGYKRLHIIISITIPLILVLLILFFKDIKFINPYRHLALYSFFYYWLIIRIYLWVKDGFFNPKINS